MSDYESALPVRGNLQDGDAYVSTTQGLLILGQNGTSNYQAVSVDANGELQVDILSIAAGSNLIGKVTINDGTTDLTVALDGSASPTNNSGIMILGEDGSGNAQYIRTDTDGKVFVIVDQEAHETDSFTYNTANLIKNTATTVVSYTPAGSTAYITGFLISGSGYMKAEVQWGTTGSETTKIVLFNSTANPNIIYNFPDKTTLNLATTETFIIKCTNLEHAASPASDFNGYATIISYQAA